MASTSTKAPNLNSHKKTNYQFVIFSTYNKRQNSI